MSSTACDSGRSCEASHRDACPITNRSGHDADAENAVAQKSVLVVENFIIAGGGGIVFEHSVGGADPQGISLDLEHFDVAGV